MEQLIYEFNGKKYLMFELLITSKSQGEKKEKLIKDCKGIVQGVKDIKIGGLFSSSYMVIKVLIPEDFIEFFANAE